MLVCVREVGKLELAQRHRRLTASPHYERYYSFYTNESTATIVDVVDSRARKTFNYDVRLESAAELQTQVVEPLLMTVLQPDRASQAVVVVDGEAGNRFSTLLDPHSGVLAHAARTAAAQPDVASLAFSAVSLEDNNTLSDILLLPDPGLQGDQEITILEDTREQFTSVEDAHYVSLESEEAWESVLLRVTNAFNEYKHQIFSFIFSFHPSTGRPNTTMQFVSFTVSEVSRGMKSSRHAVSSAAGLIECNSPTLTFTATKLLYLLKPSLLGQQPGAWVACFSPVSVLEAAQRETFQEAFAVAQTASRLYSSRIALLNASAALLPPTEPKLSSGEAGGGVVGRVGVAEGKDDAVAEVAPHHVRPPQPPLKAAPAFVPPAAGGRGVDHRQCDSLDESEVRPRSSAASSSSAVIDGPSPHLVQTPAGTFTRRIDVGGNASSLTESPHAHQPAAPSVQRAAAAVQTEARTGSPAPAPTAFVDAQQRESIQRGPSEEQAALRYEFDTYRSVMERAMAKLRADMRHYTEQISESKEEMRALRRKSREMRAELEDVAAAKTAAVAENVSLRRTLADQRREYESQLHELSELAASARSAHSPPPPPSTRQPPQHFPVAAVHDSGLVRALREDVELLEVRVSELTELVAFHQSEINDHVLKEREYRQRILDLEAALRAKEREVIASRAAAQEAQRWADGVAATPAAAAPEAPTPPPSDAPLHPRTNSAVLRDDLHDVTDRAAETECNLRAAIDELQRERTQRLQLENLLKQREREESARSVEQRTEAVVHDLQQSYEHQLRELRSEMTGFRTQLAQQLPRTSSPAGGRNSSDMQEASSPHPPQQQQPHAGTAANTSEPPPPRPPTPLRMSPMPEPAVNTSHGGHETPSFHSQRTSSRPSPAKSARRSQSFEEYMKEEPHYELHRASFLRPRPRPTS